MKKLADCVYGSGIEFYRSRMGGDTIQDLQKPRFALWIRGLLSANRE